MRMCAICTRRSRSLEARKVVHAGASKDEFLHRLTILALEHPAHVSAVLRTGASHQLGMR